MMWAEAAFSSLLILSAIHVSSIQAQPGVETVLGQAQFAHLNDAATLAAEKINSEGMFMQGGMPELAAGEAGLAISAAEESARAAMLALAVQSSLDSSTRGTPYCLSLKPKNHFISAISCRGESGASAPPPSPSNSFSVERTAFFRGSTIVFSLRQWTDANR